MLTEPPAAGAATVSADPPGNKGIDQHIAVIEPEHLNVADTVISIRAHDLQLAREEIIDL